MKSGQCRGMLLLFGMQLFLMAILTMIIEVVQEFGIIISIFGITFNGKITTSSLFFLLSFIMIMIAKSIPRPITSAEIMEFAKELKEEMDKLKKDNDDMHRQLEGATPYDELYAGIINIAIDYLKHSPDTEVVSIRSFLLYCYTGNSQEIKDAIRTLSPNSDKIQNINIYGGQNQILPNAVSAQQN